MWVISPPTHLYSSSFYSSDILSVSALWFSIYYRNKEKFQSIQLWSAFNKKSKISFYYYFCTINIYWFPIKKRRRRSWIEKFCSFFPGEHCASKKWKKIKQNKKKSFASVTVIFDSVPLFFCFCLLITKINLNLNY